MTRLLFLFQAKCACTWPPPVDTWIWCDFCCTWAPISRRRRAWRDTRRFISRWNASTGRYLISYCRNANVRYVWTSERTAGERPINWPWTSRASSPGRHVGSWCGTARIRNHCRNRIPTVIPRAKTRRRRGHRGRRITCLPSSRRKTRSEWQSKVSIDI